MAEYTLEIYRLDDGVYTRIDSFITFSPFEWSNSLCGVGGLTFQLSAYDTHASAENLVRFRNHVAVKRNNTVVWFGPITDITEDFEDVTGSIKVDCNTMLYHLIDIDGTGRYTDKIQSYVQIEQSEIAWDLINQTQLRSNGDLGIVQGNNPTSILRDRTYEYTNVGQALINLTKVIGGIEFEFVPIVDSSNLVTGVTFNVYYPVVGTLRDDLNSLKVGENIQKIKLKTKHQIANNGISEGAGTGSTISDEIAFSASQESYTRREMIYPQKDVSLLSTLSANLNAKLTERSVENYTVTLTLYPDKYPLLGTYILGDRLYIDLGIAGTGYLAGVREARVTAIEVQVTDPGKETIRPTLELFN
jgi:hypothetical protein